MLYIFLYIIYIYLEVLLQYSLFPLDLEGNIVVLKIQFQFLK